MKKVIAVPLSALYYLAFGLCLVIFHPLQWIALKLGGYQGHKKMVDVFNLSLLGCLRILGTQFKVNKHFDIPKGVPIIFVSNHQSMYDISPLSWYFKNHHPKFVSKKELGKGIPSISFNLKYGGSVLIDRKDPKQALMAIRGFAKQIGEKNQSAVIFPEGTRSKTGVPKRFSENGLKMLTKFCPQAYVVPVSINNSYKLVKHGSFPLEIGVKFSIDSFEPIPAKSMNFDELLLKVEETVKNGVHL